MNALGQRIAALIATQGPISIAEFMTIALHDPRAGYYATRDPFGVKGDFITAPEISQIFGEFLGLWCVQLWHDQGRPERGTLVELGPGRGTAMRDVLRTLKVAPDFTPNIVLVEASPILRAVQLETLHDFAGQIEWVGRFEDVICDGPLYLLANEFFDALPIRQYVRTRRGWCERRVGLDETGVLSFVLSREPVPDALVPRTDAPDGGVYEISRASQALIEDIAGSIDAQGGGALIVDYGYENGGFGETLQAVADHAFAAVLATPGESDLSAHVDFAALSQAAVKAGAEVHGPIPQGAFLDDLGITARVERLILSNPDSGDMLLKALRRLTGPDEMGTLFKALAIVPPNAPVPPGF